MGHPAVVVFVVFVVLPRYKKFVLGRAAPTSRAVCLSYTRGVTDGRPLPQGRTRPPIWERTFLTQIYWSMWSMASLTVISALVGQQSGVALVFRRL